MKRPAKIHYLSDTSCEGVGGFYLERGRHFGDTPQELTTTLERIADRRETYTII